VRDLYETVRKPDVDGGSLLDTGYGASVDRVTRLAVDVLDDRAEKGDVRTRGGARRGIQRCESEETKGASEKKPPACHGISFCVADPRASGGSSSKRSIPICFQRRAHALGPPSP